MRSTLPISLLIILIARDSCSGYRKNYDPKYDPNYDPSEEKEIPVKIKLLGDLATPHPDSDIDLGFVPKQVYYQVRRYDEKKRVPQSEAYKEASTPEEIINAPRLREVLTHKKTQEVYEEQGYEDAGYDHGGSARHKEENETLLENTEGKDSAANHPDNEEDRPSDDTRENEGIDTLSEMNSDANHRRIRPDEDEEKYDEEKHRRRGNRENIDETRNRQRKQSEKTKIKNKEFILRNDGTKKGSSKKKGSKKEKQKANRRISGDQEHKEKRRHSLSFDTEKYPFYNILNSNKYTKNSALKYALNPREVPIKLPNQMSFYNSRKLQCDDVTGPVVETPEGEDQGPDNSELKNPNRGKPRMGRLGESIDCLKRKFFGHDPLDNPFFKEDLDS